MKEKIDKVNRSVHNLKIEERRKKGGFFISTTMTESEIVQELKVDQSTISRDVKALKDLSQQFIYDLGKSDLAYYYKQLYITSQPN